MDDDGGRASLMLWAMALASAGEPVLLDYIPARIELPEPPEGCDGFVRGVLVCAGITGVERHDTIDVAKVAQTPGVLVRHGQVVSTWGTTPVLFVDGTRWMTTPGQ